MYIFFSILSVVVILAVVLPLFYIYVISRVRERLEKETISNVRDTINALVMEFNRSALSNINLLEDLTIRANKILSAVEEKERKLKIKRGSVEHKDINSSFSYRQEIDVRNRPSYGVLVDDNIESEMVVSNQEDIISEMYNLGLSKNDIALKIGRPIGEVELILSMKDIRDDV